MAWALLFSLLDSVMGYKAVYLFSFLEVLQIWRIKNGKQIQKWERK